MATQKNRSSGFNLRALFGWTESARLEDRIRSLPVLSERRTGISCLTCGFGTMFPAGTNLEGATLLRCNRDGCHFVCERTLELEAAASKTDLGLQPA